MAMAWILSIRRSMEPCTDCTHDSFLRCILMRLLCNTKNEQIESFGGVDTFGNRSIKWIREFFVQELTINKWNRGFSRRNRQFSYALFTHCRRESSHAHENQVFYRAKQIRSFSFGAHFAAFFGVLSFGGATPIKFPTVNIARLMVQRSQFFSLSVSSCRMSI